MFCEYCGSKIEEGAKFCENCGKPVPVKRTAAAAPETAVPEQAAGTAVPEAAHQGQAEVPAAKEEQGVGVFATEAVMAAQLSQGQGQAPVQQTAVNGGNAYPAADYDAVYTGGTQNSTPAGDVHSNAVRLVEDRSLFLYIILSLLTCGIYGYYFIYRMAEDVNTACREDGGRTPGLAEFLLLSIVTCGIYTLFWMYDLGNRLQYNGRRYGVPVQESGATILLWYLLGFLCCGIGPYIAMYFLIRNCNRICAAYNRKNGL